MALTASFTRYFIRLFHFKNNNLITNLYCAILSFKDMLLLDSGEFEGERLKVLT